MDRAADEEEHFVALRLGVVKLRAQEITVLCSAEYLDNRRLQQVMATAWRLLRERARAFQTFDAQVAQQLVFVQMRGVLRAFGLLGRQGNPVDRIVGEKCVPL